MLMVTSVTKTLKDDIGNDTSFFFAISFRNETEC